MQSRRGPLVLAGTVDATQNSIANQSPAVAFGEV